MTAFYTEFEVYLVLYGTINKSFPFKPTMTPICLLYSMAPCIKCEIVNTLRVKLKTGSIGSYSSIFAFTPGWRMFPSFPKGALRNPFLLELLVCLKSHPVLPKESVPAFTSSFQSPASTWKCTWTCAAINKHVVCFLVEGESGPALPWDSETFQFCQHYARLRNNSREKLPNAANATVTYVHISPRFGKNTISVGFETWH